MAYSYGTEEYENAYREELDKRLAVEQLPYLYFSPEWIMLYEKAIKEDEKYRKLGKGWEGSVVLHVEGNAEYGIDDDLYILLDLFDGDCRAVKIVPPEIGQAGDFVITGSMDRWLAVGKGQLDVVKALMQGKLKLKGDLPKIVRYVRASARLTEIASEVGGKFPDELSPEEVEQLRGWIVPLRALFGM